MFAARGLSLRPGRLHEERYEIAAARRATMRLLSSETPPSVIVCGNDVQALGALFECRALGVHVPRDLSISRFDGLDLAGHVDPAITTVSIPSAEMGARAADWLLARIEGRPAPPRTALATELLIRGTTAPPRRIPR